MSNSADIDPTLQQLIDAHPRLFRGKAPAVASYLMPGWYGLVDGLCTQLEEAMGPLVSKLEIRQIKEKFGILRVAWRLGRVPGQAELGAKVRDLVWGAEAASSPICESCGATGQLRLVDGYWTTWCDKHFAEAEAKRAAGI